jgi:hypothetical protein
LSSKHRTSANAFYNDTTIDLLHQVVREFLSSEQHRIQDKCSDLERKKYPEII